MDVKGRKLKRRNRGNFCAKEKSGICHIRGCPQIGKMLKRLDNHLSRCHRGVTRAYNDRLRTPILQSRKRVTCLLPGCFKQVLHFSRHLKNLHLMTVDEYHSKVTEVNVHGTAERAEEQVSKEYSLIKEAENLFHVTKRAEQNKHTKGNILFQDHISDFQLKKNQEKEEVLAQDSELSDPLDQESACNNSYHHDSCIVTGGSSSQHQQEEIFLPSETHACGYDENYLRFLVHNTSAHGIQFFLTAMRQSGGRLVEFQKSRLCRAILGVMSISTLKDIYLYRMYLTSFYRQASYYPYPDKSMILKCLACCATKKGTCVCPTLPKSFYVFCRQQCSGEWNCRKCTNFNSVASHVCFDFFHCQRCHEDYQSSTKHKPYP